MRIINKKYLLIILLVGVILTGAVIFKPTKEVKLDNVVVKQELDKKSFAMYIKNDDVYEAYEGPKFPEGYDLDLKESRCIDNNGQEIEDVLSYKNGEVTITSGKTTYCYLYFYLPEEKEFEYTGNYQVFIAPKNGNYQIELWGASGGTGHHGGAGGNGAYTKGIISLDKNEKIYVFVGEHPLQSFEDCLINNPNDSYNGSLIGTCVGGGGATDVRLSISETGNWDDFESLKSRIMVASGGGGGSYAGRGGAGGGLTGGNAVDNFHNNYGNGATQREYLFGKYDNSKALTCNPGNGYYSGEPGRATNAGGGSSFISGYKGCIAIKQESTEDNIMINDECTNEDPDEKCSYHYSNKIFTNMEMKAGNESMPTHDGQGTMEGNTGNGYAKIKLIAE